MGGLRRIGEERSEARRGLRLLLSGGSTIHQAALTHGASMVLLWLLGMEWRRGVEAEKGERLVGNARDEDGGVARERDWHWVVEEGRRLQRVGAQRTPAGEVPRDELGVAGGRHEETSAGRELRELFMWENATPI